MTNQFLRNNRPALIILREFHSVVPWHWTEIQKDVDDNVGIASGVKGSNLRDASPEVDGPLKATLGISHVTKELEGIEEIGFARRVRTHYEHPALEFNLSA
jgi:hypothetical protein